MTTHNYRENLRVIAHDVSEFLDFYYPESHSFLYSSLYVKRKRIMKLAVRVTAFKEDRILHDNIITFYNGLKTFFTFNTRLNKNIRNARNNKALTARSITKLKLKDIFIRYSDFLYHTKANQVYRNVKLRIRRRKKLHNIRSFIRLHRPLNKLIFLTLFAKLTQFTFKTPIYIKYNRYSNNTFRLTYLGFYLTFAIGYDRFKSFFKRVLLLALSKRLRRITYKKRICFVININRKRRRRYLALRLSKLLRVQLIKKQHKLLRVQLIKKQHKFLLRKSKLFKGKKNEIQLYKQQIGKTFNVIKRKLKIKRRFKYKLKKNTRLYHYKGYHVIQRKKRLKYVPTLRFIRLWTRYHHKVYNKIIWLKYSRRNKIIRRKNSRITLYKELKKELQHQGRKTLKKISACSPKFTLNQWLRRRKFITIKHKYLVLNKPRFKKKIRRFYKNIRKESKNIYLKRRRRKYKIIFIRIFKKLRVRHFDSYRKHLTIKIIRFNRIIYNIIRNIRRGKLFKIKHIYNIIRNRRKLFKIKLSNRSIRKIIKRRRRHFLSLRLIVKLLTQTKLKTIKLKKILY